MARHEVFSRYKGSLAGVAWVLLTPLCQLGVYTFVFGTIFQARFTSDPVPTGHFALALFAGMIFFGLFMECFQAGPALMASHRHLVTKINFPLQILPIIRVMAALVQAGFSFLVWLSFYIITMGLPTVSWLYLPLLLLPLLLLSLGCSYLLAAIGPHNKDLSHIIPNLGMALSFLSCLFYPASALPPAIQPYIFLNPLAYLIDAIRGCLVLSKTPETLPLLALTAALAIFCALSYRLFRKRQPSFADVL